ncbi:MAG: M28 family metallopeptidase [Sulfobacillus sp.]
MALEPLRRRSWHLLSGLCALGPRRAGTAASARALGWLNEQLQSAGLAVERQAFLAPNRTLYWGPVATGLVLVALAVVQLSARVLVGALVPFLMWVALVPLCGELLALGLNCDLILPRLITYNLEAEVAGSGPGEIVLVAHHDTQWSSWLFHPKVGLRLRWYFAAFYLGLFGVPALATVAAFNGHAVVLAALLGLSILLAAVTASLLVAAIFGRDVVGANDNGSGVAVAIALAQRAKQAVEAGAWPADAAKLRLLLTGGEEVGERGMLHWLKTHRPDPAQVVFINLDNVAGGTLRYLEQEGMVLPLRYAPALVRVARAVAVNARGGLFPGKPLLLPTDMMWAVAQGYAAITFIGQTDDGAIPNYHWPTDTLAEISEQHLTDVEDTLFTYLTEVWQEADRSVAKAPA